MKLLEPYYPTRRFVVVLTLLLVFLVNAKSQEDYPYSTDSTFLTIWNGSEYVPFFVKGINLGVSVPGTLPGELAAQKEDYSRWLTLINDAGFNCIRLYTLHYPRFYEVLDSFNRANKQNPILFIQGVWLNEDYNGMDVDLFNLLDTFKFEIEENIDCVHGNRIIAERFGKASGNYTVDASKWCLGFVLGREVAPHEIVNTNEANEGVDYYKGNHFSIENASASEAWFTSVIDHAVHYEHTNYNTQRPVSASSWPTLDPIIHPEEENKEEDSAWVDLSKVEIVDAPAGFFISYHAYPYYPDFISKQSNYLKYFDNYGPNSYLGYLNELKSHYDKYPLIIAEFGVPSSWAIAHYATSGMNHGGFDEYNQGLTNIRMLNTIKNSNCGGGIHFEWIDEWFKRTWMTDPVDGTENRYLWHNVAAAEQNFGLVSYKKTLLQDTIVKPNEPDADFDYISAEVNYSYFELEIGLKNPLDIPDELWVAFDTYGDTLGELQLPTSETIPFRSEFALHITNYSANLYVTEAYDVFAIWHNISDSNQLYQSIPTDGAPWKIVRVKNNYFYSDVQYIGDLQVNFSFQNLSSKDAVIISEDKIKLKIPWTYLNVVAPNKMRVVHDNKFTASREDTLTDGFNIAVQYKDQWYSTSERFKWDTWDRIRDTAVVEELKTSYYVMKNNLGDFNTPAIAVTDSFDFEGFDFPAYVSSIDGLLVNDFDMDGGELISLLSANAKNGIVFLNNDGSFSYTPNPGFSGYDTFTYSVYDGNTLSRPNSVYLHVEQSTAVEEISNVDDEILNVYPNPTNEFLHLESDYIISYFQVFDVNGGIVESEIVNQKSYTLDVSKYPSGNYIVVSKIGKEIYSNRFMKN